MMAHTAKQPDILEVISDLSNDEVFTPPKVANAVLDILPVDVWSNPQLRWLDPGCKTGSQYALAVPSVLLRLLNSGSLKNSRDLSAHKSRRSSPSKWSPRKQAPAVSGREAWHRA